MLWDQSRWDAALTSGLMLGLARKEGNPENWGNKVMNSIMDCEKKGDVLIQAMQRLQELQVGFWFLSL